MKKIFVLDTNVLLHDPEALFSFEDNEVVIPIYVVEEIDNFKKELSELGRNARQVSRHLDALRQEGSLSQGVGLDSGGFVRVAVTNSTLPPEITTDRGQDSKILAVAHDLQKNASHKGDVTFITNDSNLRIRADAIGIETENFEPERTEIDKLDTGYHTFEVGSDEIDSFYSQGYLQLKDPYYSPNEYAILVDNMNPSHTAMGKINLTDGVISPIVSQKKSAWGLRPRNKEQIFALDLLLDDSIKLVTLVGKAGTGKTLLAIAAGLQQTAEEHSFQKLLVSRPVFPLGKDIGFLPGDVEEKLNPWMQPIFDNVEFLMGSGSKGPKDKKGGGSYRDLIDLGIMQIEPLTYIRGRSIPSQYLIVDEAQNLTPHEVKTIISRAGEGTKIVLAGDPYQIDNPYVDETNNGLVHLVNHFRGEKIAGHIKLTKGERSELAELAANLL